MVKLSVASTRMKDFYDLQVLSSRFASDGKTFSEAVRKTFLNRGTELPTNRMPFAFAPEFYDHTTRKDCGRRSAQRMQPAWQRRNSTHSSKH
jgi:nucleotidyltransferase AbiEii toxin of type IV toxin-antitoxin system